ncbi:protein-glutamate O-methyltransferase CheR [Hydrogenispora sp. UU3]|uniref:protein-glutamate O-methyltransferase n=2 Tax=Capillibacterium thermochitinicola TaxID=2699427 RepID=A0A8J6LIV3_9FIRM|nr:protein-glutamate O-methyltransferase CheR [Capillibacterium thermochitinicola]
MGWMREAEDDQTMALSYEEFKKAASKLCGTDLFLYKSQQMDRRIHSLMGFWGIRDYDEYLTVLKTNPQRYQEFVKRLTINVSEFFRNPDRFIELWERFLPEILQKTGGVRIWSAGCSNGAEPYSVAIILSELNALHRASILATDIDEVVLEKARKGAYIFNEVKSLPSELREKYFRQEGEVFYFDEALKKRVQFKKHNLLQEPFPENLDLIICRNVVIYFTEEAKQKIYVDFNRALRVGGYFLTGGTEPILYYRQYGFENVAPSFYQKIGPPMSTAGPGNGV